MVTFVILMIFGTFALGYNDVLRKRYLVRGVDEQILLTLTMLLAGVLLILISAAIGFPNIQEGFWWYFIITLALNVVSQNLFIRAFKASDASTIAPLRLIIPPLVIVTGFLFLHEQPDIRGIVGIFTTIFGLWILLFSGKHISAAAALSERGVLLGLAGSVLFAVSFPLDKLAVMFSSGLFFSAMISLGVGVCTFALLQLRDPRFLGRMAVELQQHPSAFTALTLTWGVGNFLTNQALNYSLVAYASSFKRLQALWTVLLSGHLLGEKDMGRKLIATVVMLFGIVLTVL